MKGVTYLRAAAPRTRKCTRIMVAQPPGGRPHEANPQQTFNTGAPRLPSDQFEESLFRDS